MTYDIIGIILSLIVIGYMRYIDKTNKRGWKWLVFPIPILSIAFYIAFFKTWR